MGRRISLTLWAIRLACVALELSPVSHQGMGGGWHWQAHAHVALEPTQQSIGLSLCSVANLQITMNLLAVCLHVIVIAEMYACMFL